MIKRRDFLKMVGSMGAFVTLPLSKVLHIFPLIVGKDYPESWELFGGFLLLELDAPIPDFVIGAKGPILGELTEKDKTDPTVSQYLGKNIQYDGIKQLRENVNFPLFIPNPIPVDLKFKDAYITCFEASGEIWEARINFGEEGINDPTVSVSARTMFSHPYSVWPIIAYPQKDPGEPILDEEYFVKKPEKVDFTPEEGIMITTNEGYVLQWIKNNILYSLSVEYPQWLDNAASLGKLLVEI